MLHNLSIFETAHAMAVHAGQKQAVIAQNVANADTPGYVARDLASFQEVYADRDSSAYLPRATRFGHLHGDIHGKLDVQVTRDRSFGSPDGNTVSIENEMLRAVDAKRQHDRSLAIYKSALNILRTSLGRQ